MCSNLRSVSNKFEQTQIAIKAYTPDIAIFSETWITPEKLSAFEMNDFTAFHRIRNRADKHHGGGISVYINHFYSVLQSKICDTSYIEAVTVMCRPPVLPRSLPWIGFVAAYFPPNDTHGTEMSNYIISEVDRLLAINSEAGIFILGDLNALDLTNISRLSGFTQILVSPDRNNSVLSKCFTNVKFHLNVSLTAPIATSDHKVILIIPQDHKHTQRSKKKITVRENKNSNRRTMANILNCTDWSYLSKASDVQLMADLFYSHISTLSDIVFPLVSKTIKNNNHPWINNDIVKLFKTRQELKIKSTCTNEELFEVNHNLKSSIKKAKITFSNNLQLNFNKSPSLFYKQLNELFNPNPDNTLGKSKEITFKNMDINQTNVIISNYFSEILNKHSPLQMENNNTFTSPIMTPIVEQSWVAQQLKGIKKGSSSPCEIPNFIYSNFYLFLVDPITLLINESLAQGIVPSQWKASFLIPLPKIARPEAPCQLRPICISSPIGKICERHILHCILKDSAKLMDPLQFGGLPKRSTTQYLAIYCHIVLSELEKKGTKVTSIFTDFSKAFDNVNHNLMIQKMLNLNIQPSSISWIASFLTKRTIYLKNGPNNNEFLIPCSNGLPQGSVLGSFLFALFTNDFATGTTFPNHLKYVDDISIIVPSSSCDTENISQKVFDELVTQSQDIELPLNVVKCKSITHCFSRSFSISEINSDHLSVTNVSNIRLLGLYVQSDLKWDIQVSHMIKSANRRMFMLYKLKRLGASLECIKRCYILYIRPLLEYGSPVWGCSITKIQVNAIEGVQRRVCRIILKDDHVSYEKDLVKLEIPSLQSRRLVNANKFANSFALEFPDFLPVSRGKVSGKQTRQANKLCIPTFRTNRYKFSPLLSLFRNLNES